MARIEETLFEVFRRWGFRRIITPTLEFLDVVAKGIGEELKESAFKFTDRMSGQVIAVRPDITPQVARMVATRMRGLPLPLRLCYGGSVLRDMGEGGRPREIFQVGLELIGLEAPEADAEMIAIGVECLKALNIEDFKIDVGQVEFSRGILREANLPPSLERPFREALARKDVSTLGELLHQAGSDSTALLALPNLYGGEEVIEKAQALAQNDGSRAALRNLKQVIDIIKIYGLFDHISIDLGEMRGFDYHNGVIFEGFVSGQGFPVLGGGRYDALIGKYGYPCPATGFALDLESLLTALEGRGLTPTPPPIDFLLINLRRDKEEALNLARALRERGFSVARDIIKREVPGSIDYALRMRIKNVIILGAEGCQEGEVILKRLPSGEESRVRGEELIRSPM